MAYASTGQANNNDVHSIAMAEAKQDTNDKTRQDREDTTQDKTGQTGQTGQGRQDREDTTQDKTGQTGQSSESVLWLSPIDTLKKAWQLYRSKFKTLIKISIIPVFISLALILVSLLIVAMFAALIAVLGTAYTFVFVILGIILAIAVIIGLIYLSFWSQIALLYNIGTQGTVGVFESYKKTRDKIGGYAWVIFFLGISALCGYLLLVIPGVIFSIWFSFAIIVFLFENEKGMGALLKSREYVRGRWWGVLLRLWAMAGLFVLLSLFFSGIGKALEQINANQFVILAISLMEQVLTFILAPLEAVFVYCVYLNLKALKADSALIPSKKTKTAVTISIVLGLIFLVVIIGISVFAAVALSQSGIDLNSLFQE